MNWRCWSCRLVFKGSWFFTVGAIIVYLFLISGHSGSSQPCTESQPLKIQKAASRQIFYLHGIYALWFGLWLCTRLHLHGDSNKGPHWFSTPLLCTVLWYLGTLSRWWWPTELSKESQGYIPTTCVSTQAPPLIFAWQLSSDLQEMGLVSTLELLQD